MMYFMCNDDREILSILLSINRSREPTECVYKGNDREVIFGKEIFCNIRKTILGNAVMHRN